MVVALAGGSWIFLAFVIAFLAAVVYGYFTVLGSGIELRPWNDRGGAAPGARGLGSVGKDPAADIRMWTRGTGHKRRVAPPRAPERIERELDPEVRRRLDEWRRSLYGAMPSGLAVEVDPARDHVRGPDDADATVVVYADFECPACRQAMRELEGLRGERPEDVRVAYRHFPLADAHANAAHAAEAAEEAAAQGRFWDFHDAIYAHKHPPDADGLRRIAGKLGLDLERYDAALADHRHAERVAEDFESGARSGVNGTPTVFVDGIRHDDDLDARTLGTAVRAAASV